MKILQLCNRIPYPPHDGGALAMLNMLKGFQQAGEELHVMCFNTRKHYVKEEDLPAIFRDIASFQYVSIDTDLNALDALKNLFSSESYHLSRFRSEAFTLKLKELLQRADFDIVHLEGLTLALYLPVIRQFSKAKVVLRAHNIEHLIWQRMADAEPPGPKKWYLQLLARRLRKFEVSVMNNLDAIAAITEHDAQLFKDLGCKVPIVVSPTGLDLDHYPIDHTKEEWPSVFHLGALDWLPNQQGVMWFINEVWPLVRQRFPDLNFYIAGRHIPEYILSLQRPGIKVIGEVASAVDFMNARGVMIVPLLSGSGMRIKIIEGMALAKPIVSTSIGAEGIGATHNENIFIADTAAGFAGCLTGLLKNKQKADAAGAKAREFVKDHFSNRALILRLLAYYKSLLKTEAQI